MRKTIALLKVNVILLSAVILMTASTACAQKTADPMAGISLTGTERSWSNPDERYADLLDTYGDQECTGAMVVATDEDIIYLYCEDDVEKDGTTRVSQDTVFDIASVSKMFTAVCILQLAEKGKLSVDDTIDKYFPEYEAGKKITVYNLLHMTSGISDYLNNPDPFWNISGAEAADQKISDILLDKITDEELLEAMYQAPLEFEPGEKVSYSNTNYRLLAFIIEQLTGKKYCDYVKKNIFDKCGMKKTTSMALDDMTYVPYDYDDLVEYGFTDGNGYPACPNNSRGDGGIHSCLTDMVLFDRALFGGKLLSEQSMEILLNDDDTGYCCGLRKEKTGYSHDGSSLTCSAFNRMIESEECGHIYLITFTHSGKSRQSDEAVGPMAGTKYTRGVFTNGVYINDHAEIKMNIPEECRQTGDGDIERIEQFVLSLCTEEKDKLRQSADMIDSYFESGGYYISFEFVNTRLGIPDDPDCTEDEYLDYSKEFLMGPGTPPYAEFEYGERTKAELGNKEYVREVCTVSADGMRQFYYDYARRIDDDLMCVIEICGISDITPEYFEQLFDRYEGPKGPMSGTNYTKGVFENGVYTNEYAGVRVTVPEDCERIPEELLSDTSDIVDDCETEKDKLREAATVWDCSFYRAAKDNIHFKIVNTALAAPDNADYSENDYIDDFSAYMGYNDAKKWNAGDRVTVGLGGNDYVKQTYSGFDSFTGGNQSGFIYARKLDDDLMYVVWIIVFDDDQASPEEYESLFCESVGPVSGTDASE